MIETKFKLGEMVSITLYGYVEGVSVTVKRNVVVIGMLYAYQTVGAPILIYTLAEHLPGIARPEGKVWQKNESEIQGLDPLVEAVAGAQS